MFFFLGKFTNLVIPTLTFFSGLSIRGVAGNSGKLRLINFRLFQQLQ